MINDDGDTFRVVVARHWSWVEQQGWHNKTNLENVALIAEEVGELAHAVRLDGLGGDISEEMADVVLRVMDLSVCMEIDLQSAIDSKMAKNRFQGNRERKR